MKKSLFIHIPKNAGSSFRHLPHWEAVQDFVHPLRPIERIEERIRQKNAESLFKFAFTRNPYARFYSTYRYFFKMTSSHANHRYNVEICELIQGTKSFDDFCALFKTSRKLNRNFHFRRQVDYIFDVRSSPVVDYLGSVESYKTDLIELLSVLEIENKKYIHGNDFDIPLKNASGESHEYQFYFQESAQAADLVLNHYLADFIALGYSQNLEDSTLAPTISFRP